ncbi:hypothetical protein DFP73DRAFT_528078 [Morchella snyderi]|nr:hypothetical protein DFP73DRAFT_528078 [Morchella snyderi]
MESGDCSWSSAQCLQKVARNDMGSKWARSHRTEDMDCDGIEVLSEIPGKLSGMPGMLSEMLLRWVPKSMHSGMRSEGVLRFFPRVIQILLRALLSVLSGVVILEVAGIACFLHFWHILCLLLHFNTVSIAISEMEFYPSRAASSSGCVGRTEKLLRLIGAMVD